MKQDIAEGGIRRHNMWQRWDEVDSYGVNLQVDSKELRPEAEECGTMQPHSLEAYEISFMVKCESLCVCVRWMAVDGE